MEQRLHKVLAAAGVGSRRHCEELIAEGRVRVDGRVVTQLGTKVDLANSTITFDGRPVRIERSVSYLVHKPKGYVCTSGATDRAPRVIDLVPSHGRRLFTVGRLDKDSTGLIIVTNDGELSNLVTHPRYGVRKTYVVTVDGEVTREHLDRVRRGIHLSEGRTLPAEVHVLKSGPGFTTLRMTVKEGRNRLVRRMLARLGFKVRSLTRTAVGPLTLRGLKPGRARVLGSREIEALRESALRASGPD